MKLRLLLGAILIVAVLYVLNRWLNETPRYLAGVPSTGTPVGGEVRETFVVGFLPVTCHLTCPVTSWVTQHSTSGTRFQSQKFTDFPSMKEALIARKIDATFMNAPLAPKLVMDGVPVKIVYLGHRDGTAVVVGTNSPIRTFEDLRGKVVAIPGRFSNQNIFLHRTMKQLGMPFDSMSIKELPPPEHPSSLASGAIDAYIIGEPHAAKAEMDGYGRVLLQMRDAWPQFISCVLVVRQELIDQRPELVHELVRGIAASGEWLDADREAGAQHRRDAALVASNKAFYNQPKALLEFVLLKDVTRVSYTNLLPPKHDFDEIMDLAVELGILPRRIPFEDYVDTRFAPDLETVDLGLDRLPAIETLEKP
ncbi:MAG: ABC transporter substrate-binding protein [Planctomycetes bacterium]|nr:ABC transporter substrate-binding protein [Planctomycetota bacterium]